MISLEKPHRKWSSSRLEGKSSLIFLELRQVLSSYDGDLRDPLWWPQERLVPMRVARRPLGVPLPSMQGPKTLCGGGAELDVLLQSLQRSQCSSPVGACSSAYLPSCSSSVTLPVAWIKGSVAFPRGFPTRLYHKAFPHGCPT